MNVGQAQIISKNIPGAGRLPPCGSRHGQAGIPTPRSMSGGGPGCSCPREQGQALPSKPRACQSRCQALARAAPVRRCLVPSRAVRPIERPVGRRVRRGVTRHACQAALQVACRPTYPMSGGVAGAVQPSLPRPLWGHSSLLLPIRVSPCNLALPVYKGGQGLLCEEIGSEREDRAVEPFTTVRLHLLPLAEQLEERHCSPIQRTIIPYRQAGVGVLPPYEGPEPG